MGQQLFRNRRRKNKKLRLIIIATVAAAALAVGLVLWGLSSSLGQGDGSSFSSTATADTAKTLPKSFIDRNTASSSIALLDVTDGKVLYRKNADVKRYPASMTKLLTALVAVENTPSPDTPITVGQEVHLIDPQSTRAHLTVGTRLTLEHLLYAMLLPSGNDAAYVLAVQVGRMMADDQALEQRAAVRLFADKMNEKAAALGCTGSHFVNPDGIHDDNHYTTADDMLKIAAAALQNHTIATVTAATELNDKLLSGQTVNWRNGNRLMHQEDAYYYEGAVGLKTGFTDQAGYCLAAAATREGRTAIAVVMHADSSAGRFEDARGLLDICFQ